LLGYSETSAFSRAFRRWFGASTAAWSTPGSTRWRSSASSISTHRSMSAVLGTDRIHLNRRLCLFTPHQSAARSKALAPRGPLRSELTLLLQITSSSRAISSSLGAVMNAMRDEDHRNALCSSLHWPTLIQRSISGRNREGLSCQENPPLA